MPNRPSKDRSTSRLQKFRSKSVWFKRSQTMFKFRGSETALIWVVEIRLFQFLCKLSIQIKKNFKWSKTTVCPFLDLYFEWFKRHKLRVRAILIFFATQIKVTFGSFFWISKFEHSLRSLKTDGFGPGFLYTFCRSILWGAV